MASRLPSASTRKNAQVTCQLCQRSSPLKWKCNDCDILMCDNCKTNVHARVKTATRHKIVEIKDIDFSELNEPSVDLDNIPCKTHSTQSCCVYCIQCKELICPKCLKTHKGHDVEEIETQYIQNLEYLRGNVSDNIDPNDLTSIFGSLNKLSMQTIITNPEKINLTKTNTFEVNLPFVQIIVTTSVNSVWITCMQTRTLQEMKIEQTLKSLREYNDKSIYAMAMSKTGDVLLTLAEYSHLYRLDETGMIDVVHDFSPLLPKAIHANGNGIIVSTREKGDAFPITKHSRRQIVVLAKKRIIEYDKQNKRLFSLIGGLTMNKTGHIFGIDCPSFVLRRIVKVDNNSIEWKFTY
ncbi:uncharacterized protein LOC134690126 [Mytilus trossulus]|uniref:uncharacterized protein LOC134690126 n=1 Tax=Mytilus trossulus TaxID=6551 RepID=UPI003005577D